MKAYKRKVACNSSWVSVSFVYSCLLIGQRNSNMKRPDTLTLNKKLSWKGRKIWVRWHRHRRTNTYIFGRQPSHCLHRTFSTMVRKVNKLWRTESSVDKVASTMADFFSCNYWWQVKWYQLFLESKVITWTIRLSILSSTTSLIACTGRCWPKRWIRSIASAVTTLETLRNWLTSVYLRYSTCDVWISM